MISASVLNEWYPVAMASQIRAGKTRETLLLGQPITVTLTGDAVTVQGKSGPLHVCEHYGHVWACPGTPAHDLFPIPEAAQPGRRLVDVGVVRVKCSPLRAVENFLDIAHFPFIHTDVLGAEPHTEVNRYEVAIREESDEVWATKVTFYQPQAAKSAAGGIVQPLTEELCDVWPWMALFDDTTPQAELIAFQQMIFLQDRSILENQIPRLLPLDPGMEIPTQADLTSIAYRRWLKRRGLTYGAQMVAA
jgi:phenylpropionate dioxygenase-like ring-hydroxylating dioxygenase large terminal subunit